MANVSLYHPALKATTDQIKVSLEDTLIDPVIKDSFFFLTVTVKTFTTGLLTYSSADSVPLEANVSFGLLAIKSHVTHPSGTRKGQLKFEVIFSFHVSFNKQNMSEDF